MEGPEGAKRGDGHFLPAAEWSIGSVGPREASAAAAKGDGSSNNSSAWGTRGILPDLSARFAAARRSSSASGSLQKYASSPLPYQQHAQQQQQQQLLLQQQFASLALHPCNTESDIINAFEDETGGGAPMLQYDTSAFLLQQQQQQQQQQAAAEPDFVKRQPTYVQEKHPISSKSFQRLIIKQFSSVQMSASAIRLSKAFNGYLLEDSTGELGIDRLPLYHGNVHTAPGSSWPRCRVRWSARYFLLYRGHWFWFRDRRAYEVGGLEGCLGSVSLIINPLSIDLDPRCSTRFSLCIEGWCSIVVDTSVQRQDRGAWVVHFLAYANKGEQLREKFPEVDWEELCRRCRLAVRQANEHS